MTRQSSTPPPPTRIYIAAYVTKNILRIFSKLMQNFSKSPPEKLFKNVLKFFWEILKTCDFIFHKKLKFIRDRSKNFYRNFNQVCWEFLQNILMAKFSWNLYQTRLKISSNWLKIYQKYIQILLKIFPIRWQVSLKFVKTFLSIWLSANYEYNKKIVLEN